MMELVFNTARAMRMQRDGCSRHVAIRVNPEIIT